MQSKPYAAFGWLLCISKANAGESIRIKPVQRTYPGHIFYLSGSSQSTEDVTGELFPVRSPGWFSLENEQIADSDGWTIHYLEDTEWVCIHPEHNYGELPEPSSLVLKAGESQAVESGADLFLAKGSLSIGGKTFDGPTQIRVRTDGKALAASTDCYLLRFK